MIKSEMRKSASSQDSLGPFTIFLLLTNNSDRKLVKKALPEKYRLCSDEEVFKSGAFDLLITDEHQFQIYATHFRKLRHDSQPVLLPVLLLSKRQSYTKSDNSLLELVDDIISIPTSSEVLKARVNLLMKTKSYSMQLQEEKRKFQLLAENSTDLISTHTLDGTYTYVSPSSEQIFGYTPEELIGENAFDFIHPDDREAVIQSRKKVLGSSQPQKVEFRKETKKGGYKWVESINKSVEHSRSSGNIEIQASTREITDRKVYEEKLKKEATFTDAVLDFMPDIFFMINSQQNFIRWNKNMITKLGYSSSEIKKMTPNEFLEGEDVENFNKMVREISLTGGSEIEADLITKGGDQIRHRIRGQKFVQYENHFIICTCVDISRQHQMMIELQDSNEEIQVLLKEIHHRVKNNLAVVSGMLEMQSMESDNRELQTELKDSRLRIQSIASIHELLYRSNSFSKIGMEKYLGELVSQIQETHGQSKKVDIVKNIEAVELNINQAMPCALIANEIITNAFKHAFKGRERGQITIDLENKNNNICLTISDNGVGLAKDVDFDRPHSLGMKLIKVLTIQLEAELETTSEKGSTFELSFTKEETSGSSSKFV